MKIAQINNEGFAVALTSLPPGTILVSAEDTMNAEGKRLRIGADGAEEWVWDHRGQVCHIGTPARTISTVPIDPALIGKNWDELAALGYHQYPAPETAAEKRARERAEAEALAAAEAARIAGLTASKRQFAYAAALAGAITFDEALAWASANALPPAIEAVLATLPEAEGALMRGLALTATEFRRSHPATNSIGAALGKSPAEIDALFVAAQDL